MVVAKNNSDTNKQYILSIVVVTCTALTGYIISGYVGYRVVAFMLLVSVSLLSMLFGIGPVLLAAILSALVWDFFFIPPRFTFRVDNAEDALLLLMYFVISLVNGVLTFKIRQREKEISKKEEKEKAIKLYDTLLNSLSHELRTPIATILGAADNLQENAKYLSEENKAALVSEISKASLRLNRQVGNLLDMSRLESGFIQAKKDWCDMNELIYSVLNKLHDNLNGHKVVVAIPDELPLFRLDIGLTEQVLYNLIYNAAFHTIKGSVITIKAACVDDNKCEIYVADNGFGFPADEIDKVFDKFYRLPNAKTGGTGLGLSIVKGFVEAQGGTITLRNNVKGGAEFTIEIPAETSYLKALKNE